MKKLIFLLGLPACEQGRVGRALLEKCPGSAWIQAQWCNRAGTSLAESIRETTAQNILSLSTNYLAQKEINLVCLSFTLEDEPEEILPALTEAMRAFPAAVQVHAIALERRYASCGSFFQNTELPWVDTATMNIGQLCYAILTQLEEPPQRTLGGKPRKRRFASRALIPLLLLPVLLAGLVLGRVLTPQPATLPAPSAVTTAPSVSSTPTTVPPTTQPSTVTRDTEETEASSEPETTEATDTTQPDSVADYVVNRNSMKFHLPDCPSVEKMKESNREYFTGTRQELLDRGCSPCGSCKP